jgi:hypothetical protein
MLRTPLITRLLRHQAMVRVITARQPLLARFGGTAYGQVGGANATSMVRFIAPYMPDMPSEWLSEDASEPLADTTFDSTAKSLLPAESAPAPADNAGASAPTHTPDQPRSVIPPMLTSRSGRQSAQAPTMAELRETLLALRAEQSAPTIVLPPVEKRAGPEVSEALTPRPRTPLGRRIVHLPGINVVPEAAPAIVSDAVASEMIAQDNITIDVEPNQVPSDNNASMPTDEIASARSSTPIDQRVALEMESDRLAGILAPDTPTLDSIAAGVESPLPQKQRREVDSLVDQAADERAPVTQPAAQSESSANAAVEAAALQEQRREVDGSADQAADERAPVTQPAAGSESPASELESTMLVDRSTGGSRAMPQSSVALVSATSSEQPPSYWTVTAESALPTTPQAIASLSGATDRPEIKPPETEVAEESTSTVFATPQLASEEASEAETRFEDTKQVLAALSQSTADPEQHLAVVAQSGPAVASPDAMRLPPSPEMVLPASPEMELPESTEASSLTLLEQPANEQLAHNLPHEPAPPLRESTRRFLLPLVGIDPVDADVHRDAPADAMAQAYDADAIAIGSDIFLSAGRTDDTPATLGLIAHELTHVARRHRPRFVPPIVRGESIPPGHEEQLAEGVEAQVMASAGERAAATLRVISPNRPPPFSVPQSDSLAPVAHSDDRSLWHNIPAPWEPVPSWMSNPTPTHAQPVLPAMQTANADVSPVPEGRLNESSIARAESSRQSASKASAITTRSSPQQPTPVAKPDLDMLARQVYAMLKRRLAAERRRQGT